MFPDRPRLRPHLTRATRPHDPEHIYIADRLGLAKPLALTPAEFAWLDFLDGQQSVLDIQIQATRLAGGAPVSSDQVRHWLGRLEQGLLLDSPRFHNVASAPVRPPRCIGCYEGDPDALRLQLHRLFTHPRGAGLPRQSEPDGSLRAALIPHMDYARGGLTYTYAFKEIAEKSDASLFVIIGTSHYSGQRFTLTRKNFQTPLGIVPTDQDYIDRLVRQFGNGLFDDEWLAHFPEHSIELEVVFLKYLFGSPLSSGEGPGVRGRPIRIVPLVVGSFHDCVRNRQSPRACPDIAGLIDALRKVEEETKEPICYLISGDLAHIGPKFNGAEVLDDRLLERSYRQDLALVQHAEAVDLDGYFRVIAEESDARNICGLPPTLTTLAALHPRAGKLLHYDRYVHPKGFESVSFASMGFYR